MINCRKLGTEIIKTISIIILDLKATNVLVHFKKDFAKKGNHLAFNIESSYMYNKK